MTLIYENDKSSTLSEKESDGSFVWVQWNIKRALKGRQGIETRVC